MQVAKRAPTGSSPTAPTGRSAAFLLELGLTLAALGERDEALATLREAVLAKPGLTQAWQALAKLQEGTAEAAHARQMAAQGVFAATRPVKTPSSGKIAGAERALYELIMRAPPQQAGGTLRAHLRQSPGDVAALRILAEIGVRGGHLPPAEMLLARALELAPGYTAARHNYATVLMMQGKSVVALKQAERLVAEDPRHAEYRMLRAQALAAVGQHEAAIAIFEALVGDGIAKIPGFWLGFGNSLKYAGRRADSVSAYRRVLALQPGSGEAYWGLANLKNAQFGDGDLAAMRAALAGRGTSPKDLVHLHYALGRALEQEGAYAESFGHYAEGAKLQRGETGYSAEDWRGEMRRSMRFFTSDFFAAHEEMGCSDAAPIFIVGLPRSGSTLIEQILASHSTVEGTQELPEIGNIVRAVGGSFTLGQSSGYPERLGEMSAADIAALGARYIANTQFYRKTARPFFIDKMPANWAYVGLIRTILPNAKIIDARRHPMASCFSAFKQLFGSGALYSYNLRDLGMYYHDYMDMMAHIDAVQPGRVHRVVYENMVEDTESEIRALLTYCGLDFEPACLRFWESTRAVSTPSAEQVRQPIFRDGLNQWQNYAPWLGDLAEALDKK